MGGNQQINNGQANNASNTPAAIQTDTYAKAIENQPNELLSEMNNATLDSSGTATTSSAKRQWQPWQHSTGARTLVGKAIASRNAFKGSVRQQLKELNQILRDQRSALNEIS